MTTDAYAFLSWTPEIFVTKGKRKFPICGLELVTHLCCQCEERLPVQPLHFPGCMSRISWCPCVQSLITSTDRSGMAAPMVGGILLAINPAFPVFASAVVFALAGCCVLLLKENEGSGTKKGGRAVMVH